MSEDTFELGESLELQIVKNSLSSRAFIVSIAENIRPEFFENLTAKIAMGIIKDYFLKFSDVPNADIIKVESKKYLSPKDDEALFLRELDGVASLEVKNEDYLRTKVLEHCQHAALRRAILQSADLLKERGDNYKGEILEKVRAAMMITESSDLGLNYFKNPEERIVSEMKYKKHIKTGLHTLDKITCGGWSFEDTTLAIVVAPTGVGKSIFLCKFGSYALLHSHKVVHITHELSASKTAARYDSLLTQIGQSERSKRIEDMVRKLKIVESSCGGENLRIKEFPTKTCSPLQIRAYLEKLRDFEGFVPDLIVNDYLDLMVANNGVFSDNDYQMQKRVSEELRAIAQEYRVPIVTASQTHRAGAEKEVIEGTDVAESYGKVMTSDILLTMSQSAKDKFEGKCNLYIAKYRNGPSGIMMRLAINYEMMNIIERTESYESARDAQGIDKVPGDSAGFNQQAD